MSGAVKINDVWSMENQTFYDGKKKMVCIAAHRKIKRTSSPGNATSYLMTMGT